MAAAQQFYDLFFGGNASVGGGDVFSAMAIAMALAMTMVMANSRKIRPMIPAIKTMGIKTQARERVIERMVKLICLEPLREASQVVFPISA